MYDKKITDFPKKILIDKADIFPLVSELTNKEENYQTTVENIADYIINNYPKIFSPRIILGFDNPPIEQYKKLMRSIPATYVSECILISNKIAICPVDEWSIDWNYQKDIPIKYIYDYTLNTREFEILNIVPTGLAAGTYYIALIDNFEMPDKTIESNKLLWQNIEVKTHVPVVKPYIANVNSVIPSKGAVSVISTPLAITGSTYSGPENLAKAYFKIYKKMPTFILFNESFASIDDFNWDFVSNTINATMPTNNVLKGDETLLLQIKYESTNGRSSEWSDIITINFNKLFLSKPVKPMIATTPNGLNGRNFRITPVSSISVDPSKEPIKNNDIQIWDSSASSVIQEFTNITNAFVDIDAYSLGFPKNTTFLIRSKSKTEHWVSEWSDFTNMVTSEYLDLLNCSLAVSGTSPYRYDETFTLTSNSINTFTNINAKFEFSTKADFSTTIHKHSVAGQQSLTYKYPTGLQYIPNNTTTLYARARYEGTISSTLWSPVITMQLNNNPAPTTITSVNGSSYNANTVYSFDVFSANDFKIVVSSFAPAFDSNTLPRNGITINIKRSNGVTFYTETVVANNNITNISIEKSRLPEGACTIELVSNTGYTTQPAIIKANILKSFELVLKEARNPTTINLPTTCTVWLVGAGGRQGIAPTQSTLKQGSSIIMAASSGGDATGNDSSNNFGTGGIGGSASGQYSYRGVDGQYDYNKSKTYRMVSGGGCASEPLAGIPSKYQPFGTGEGYASSYRYMTGAGGGGAAKSILPAGTYTLLMTGLNGVFYAKNI